MSSLKHLFEKNQVWAAGITSKNPMFFERLARYQSPKILWIGCADSRVPANQIIDLAPGDVFVHRNIANIVVHSDLNCLSVMQFAVEVLRVEHIIVCGHYDCGGVKAAIDHRDHGLIDNWLRHIKDVERFHEDRLETLQGEEYVDRLCELNVVEQVRNVRNTTIVKDWQKSGSPIEVHGWIYDIRNGILKDVLDE